MITGTISSTNAVDWFTVNIHDADGNQLASLVIEEAAPGIARVEVWDSNDHLYKTVTVPNEKGGAA